jgi:hypothetical protein
MKLSQVPEALKPFLAKDAKPEEVLAALIAADKAMDKSAKDKRGKDKARDEDPEEPAAEDEDDTDAEDSDVDPEGTNDADPDAEDEEGTNPVGKPKAGAKDKRGKDKARDNEMPANTNTGTPKKEKSLTADSVNKLVAEKLAARDALHAARRDVEPVLGEVAYDSAEEVYAAALTELGVDTKDVPAGAYRAMYQLARKQGEAVSPIAEDSAIEGEGSMDKLIPGFSRLA